MFGKKIISAVLAISMLVCVMPAFAKGQYYITNQYPDVQEAVLQYTETDVGRADYLEKLISTLVAENGNNDKVTEAVDELYDLFVTSTDDYSLALLQSDKQDTEINRQILMKASENTLNVQGKLYNAFEVIYKSDYSYIIEDILGSENVELFMESIPGERYYELAQKEEELINNYNAVYGDDAACAKIYLELVNIRNEIAEETGYDNYAELANKSLYYRDYTDEETEAFASGVVAYYTPLLQSLVWVADKLRLKAIPMSEENIISSVEALLNDIEPELGATFTHMKKNGLYDIAYSAEKSENVSAYTLYINKLKVPYIFAAPNMDCMIDGADTLKTLIHESGHYAALLNDPINYENTYILNNAMVVDTAEVHSQGLEMLSVPYYGKLFGSNSAAERINQLTKTVSAVVDGMMMHEFQTKVYQSENLTVDRINAIAADTMGKYYDMECTPEAAQLIWTAVPHTFTAPMYYLAYAVSGAAALGIFAEAGYDYESAKDKYMQLSSLGVHVSFGDAANLCGLGDIFNPDVMQETVYEICEAAGLLYEDLDYDAWYMDYFFKVSELFADDTETDFEPERNITRGEFVEVIGKMYDYYIGADMDYETHFEDVSVFDDTVKYIDWASDAGIIEGYSDTVFGVDDAITREQLVTVMHRLALYEAKVSDAPGKTDISFSDCGEISDWAKDSMAWAVQCGIITGHDDNTVTPKKNTTRAEATKIIACYIDEAY